VIGSVGDRGELSAAHVKKVRELLDRFYKITVTDTGNNHLASCYQTAVATADAVLVPVTLTPSSVEGGLRTIARIRALTAATTGLHTRVTIVITHDGGPEDRELIGDLTATLAEVAACVVEVPYDDEIRRDDEIAWGRLSTASQRAWMRVAARVVDSLLLASETALVG
jgi:cellulose biosynthesis protein BcsQ